MNGDTAWRKAVGIMDRDDHDNQEHYIPSTKTVMETSLRASMSSKLTKVFKNLCDDTDLAAWNAMQKDRKIVIIDVKDIPAPKNSEVLVDAIRVNYVELDIDKFNVLFTYEMLHHGFDLGVVASMLMPGEFTDLIRGILDNRKEEGTQAMKEVLEKFLKYGNTEFLNHTEINEAAERVKNGKSVRNVGKLKKNSDVYNNSSKDPETVVVPGEEKEEML